MSYSEPISYFNSAGKIISNTFDSLLSNGVVIGNISKQAASHTSDVIANSTNNIIRSQTEHNLNLVTKVLGISVASAAVLGSAFYFGYNFAKKSHRFHLREADKNDQVAISLNFIFRICILKFTHTLILD